MRMDMKKRASTCSWSRSDRAGVVLGSVLGLMALLGALAFVLWYMTTTSLGNIARESGGQVYYELAASALAEVVADMDVSVMASAEWHGLKLEHALGRDYPFPEKQVEPALTLTLA